MSHVEILQERDHRNMRGDGRQRRDRDHDQRDPRIARRSDGEIAEQRARLVGLGRREVAPRPEPEGGEGGRREPAAHRRAYPAAACHADTDGNTDGNGNGNGDGNRDRNSKPYADSHSELYGDPDGNAYPEPHTNADTGSVRYASA